MVFIEISTSRVRKQQIARHPLNQETNLSNMQLFVYSILSCHGVVSLTLLCFTSWKGSAFSIGKHTFFRANLPWLKSTIKSSSVSTSFELMDKIAAIESYWDAVDKDIWIQESNQEVILSDSSLVVLLAARILDYELDIENGRSTSDIMNNTNHQPIFEYQGALLQQNDESLQSLKYTIQLSTNIRENYTHFMWDTSSTNTTTIAITVLDEQVALFNILLQRYLHQEKYAWISRQERTTFKIVLDEDMDPFLLSLLESIGIRKEENDSSFSSSSIRTEFPLHLPKFVPYLHTYAFRHRATIQGRTALLVLQQLSQRRVAFDVSTFHVPSSSASGTILSLEQDMLPLHIVSSVMNIMKHTIQPNQWLSTNPDSVDGIPSLHLNLISGGKDMFHNDSNDDEKDDGEISFVQCVTELIRILKPILYDKLLPRVRELTQSSTVEISDVFLRSYGKDGAGSGVAGSGVAEEEEEDAEEHVRYGLSSHYDITSYVTCVVALDDTALLGSNGLYTIISEEGSISNHAALRKFFPLGKGDAVIHSFDVLHGVDIDPSWNQSRTSMIVWFVDDKSNGSKGDNSDGLYDEDGCYPPSWLKHPRNDVEEFLLGLVLEDHVRKTNTRNDDKTMTMIPNSSSSDGGGGGGGNDVSIDNLYVQSAMKGNSFALHALAQRMTEKHPSESLNPTMKLWNSTKKKKTTNPFLSSSLCQALWFESSMLGNSNAQVSLADDIMMNVFAGHGMDEEYDDNDTHDDTHNDTHDDTHNDTPLSSNSHATKETKYLIFMASTFLTMANIQGLNVTMSLKKILNYYLDLYHEEEDNNIGNEDELDPVIQMLLLSL